MLLVTGKGVFIGRSRPSLRLVRWYGHAVSFITVFISVSHAEVAQAGLNKVSPKQSTLILLDVKWGNQKAPAP